MNTSAHVSLDSLKKIENLAVATTATAKQLRSEGRLAAENSITTAHYYMTLARTQYEIIDATEGATND